MRTETRQSIVLTIGTGATAAFSLVYVAYVGRVLGPERYADFTAVLSFVLLCTLALGPINPIVARFTAQYASQRAYGKIRTLSYEITRRLALYGFAGIVLGLLALKPLTSTLRFHSILPLLVAYGMVYLNVMLTVPRGVLRGVQNFGKYNVNIVLEAAIRLGIGVIVLECACGAVSGLLPYLAALAAILFYSRIQLRGVWAGHEPEPVDGGAIKRFTVPMFLMAFGGAGFQNIDILFVKHYFAEADAGLYGAAANLAKSINVLVTPFSILLLPLLITLRQRGRRVPRTFLRVCAYFLLLSAGPMVLFWLWPGAIMVLVYGQEFAAGAPVLLPLAAALLLGCLSTLTGLSFASADRFGFLYIYLLGLAIEAAGFALWHTSLQTVVAVVLTAQTVTMTAMVVWFILDLRCRRQNSDAEALNGFRLAPDE